MMRQRPRVDERVNASSQKDGEWETSEARQHTRIDERVKCSMVNGVLAQLVERCNGIAKVTGSTPVCSTFLRQQ